MDLDTDRNYRAIRSRDPRFDGRFFSAVRTTGIYCRPICPATTPKRENVSFYPCAAAAEEAGFRPCRRCHPEASPGTPAWIGTSATVSRALRMISRGDLDTGSVHTLADKLGIGERHLRRLFTRHLGASPRRIAVTRRIHFGFRLIRETELPMSRVAMSAGFPSIRQFNHAIRDSFRSSPTRLRRKSVAGTRRDAGDLLLLRLSYRPPYRWGAIRDFLAARAIPGVEIFKGDSYCRVVRTEAGTGVIRVRQGEDGHHLLLEVPSLFSADLIRMVERVRRLFDLAADPLPIVSRLRTDPILAERIRGRPGIRVPGAWDGFELAVRAILGQQVTVRGATTLSGRLVRRFGKPLHASNESGLTHSFPDPETLARADCTVAGIPRARAEAIRGLAREISRKTLVLENFSGLEEAVDRLTETPGIGKWTAHYIAMRVLGEPDAFPSGDLGLRRALSRNGSLISERQVIRRAEPWRPWRAYAAMYLWLPPIPGKIQRRKKDVAGNRRDHLTGRKSRPGVPAKRTRRPRVRRPLEGGS